MFYLHHLFRSFLPLHNPIGFGAADFIELAIAIVMLALVLGRDRLVRFSTRFAERTGWCMLVLFLLPLVLRLAMVSVHPIPTPLAIDDFSYVLLGDTLSHFRFSNPPHPMHRFFETLFVLQEPRYASVYPMGQGVALAIGQILFRNPWAGVAISIGLFCAACYWMLRGWVSPGWSLAGGIFAALQYGALSQWMNSFWGGAVAGIAGCLVFGAIPRFEKTGERRYAILIGAGIGISALSRPYETIFLSIAVLFFLIRKPRALVLISIAVLPALGLTALQNKSVTGNWTTLPAVESRWEYGVPTTFLQQPNPIPHRDLNPQQRLGYEVQKTAHDDNLALGFFGRLANRMKVYRFYFLAPLILVLPWFVSRRYVLVLATVILFAVGTNFYPYFYSHYIAAIACLFVLMIVVALERAGPQIASIVMFVCATHFVFWYGVHFAGNRAISQFETEDAINTGDPQGRKFVRDQLDAAPGKQLVFVRYRVGHAFEEWVYNRAEIDASRIVWAHDLGADENEKLRQYYPDRTAWLLQPDVHPLLLAPWSKSRSEGVTEVVAPPADNTGQPKKKPRVVFEDIH